MECISLNYDLVGKVRHSLSNAAGGCQIDLAVGGYVNGFKNCNIDLSKIAIAQILRHEREVEVGIYDLFPVDGIAHCRVRDERRSEVQRLCTCEHTVNRIACRRTRKEIYLERFTCSVRLLGALCNLGQHQFRSSR